MYLCPVFLVSVYCIIPSCKTYELRRNILSYFICADSQDKASGTLYITAMKEPDNFS